MWCGWVEQGSSQRITSNNNSPVGEKDVHDHAACRQVFTTFFVIIKTSELLVDFEYTVLKKKVGL